MLLRRRLHCALAACALLAGPALAAPVDAGSVAADPYELAVRWTLASLSPRALPPVPAAEAAPPVARLSSLPAVGVDGHVPDPSGYALMGALLLGAGLLTQRLAARRRGTRRPGRG
jgi:hypothetical protein